MGKAVIVLCAAVFVCAALQPLSAQVSTGEQKAEKTMGQSAVALEKVNNSARQFAPGQLKTEGSAKAFAPGQLKTEGSAKEFAPGQLKKMTDSAGTDPLTQEASQKLLTDAWTSLGSKDYAAAIKTATQIITANSKLAVEQQASLTDFAPAGSEGKYWALNDVATAHFILAQAAAASGDSATAKANYQKIIDTYSFAQAWDSQGWFWKVAQGAKEELTKLNQPAA